MVASPIPSLGATRVFGRVGVCNSERPFGIDLYDRVGTCEGKMIHVRRKIDEAAGSKPLCFRLVEFVSHPETTLSRDDGHFLSGRVAVRWDLIAGRHLQSDRKWACLAGIAGENSELSAFRQNGRSGPPDYLGGGCRVSASVILRTCRSDDEDERACESDLMHMEPRKKEEGGPNNQDADRWLFGEKHAALHRFV